MPRVYADTLLRKNYSHESCFAVIRVTLQWASWRLKSPASRLFAHPFVQAHQRKHQSSASPAFVRGIHRWSVDSHHKVPVTWNMFSFDDVIMVFCCNLVSVDFTVFQYIFSLARGNHAIGKRRNSWEYEKINQNTHQNIVFMGCIKTFIHTVRCRGSVLLFAPWEILMWF